MKKTLLITAATIVFVVLVATAGLVMLSSGADSHQTCGVTNPAELRHAGDPRFAKQLEALARCPG